MHIFPVRGRIHAVILLAVTLCDVGLDNLVDLLYTMFACEVSIAYLSSNVIVTALFL